jgi:protein gp37
VRLQGQYQEGESMSKIGWCDLTLNPISGCKNGCEYCYARGIYHRFNMSFEPAFHPERLQKIRNLKGKGKRVFLDSASDWFSEGVESGWIAKTIEAVSQKTEHTFLVLTKRPDRILELIGGAYKVPDYLWLGVSVTEQTDTWRIRELEKVCCKRFISFEPLHGPIKTDLSKIHWVIIGAETGARKNKVIPQADWINNIGWAARDLGIPIFMKDNLSNIFDLLIQEFPEVMR